MQFRLKQWKNLWLVSQDSTSSEELQLVVNIEYSKIPNIIGKIFEKKVYSLIIGTKIY